MYKQNKLKKTSLEVNESYEDESLEAKLRRQKANKEPIQAVSPITFTERKDGVRPEFDIRTDRFDLAIDATDKMSRSKLARREGRIKDAEDKAAQNRLKNEADKNSGTEASTSDPK